MVLVDTSIWLDYLRKGNPHLVRLLDANLVSVHPWVVGELGCGNLEDRASVLGLLRALPQLPVATEDEMAHFLERHPLAGKGIGYLDMHLLAAALLGDARLWVMERHLGETALELGVLYEPVSLRRFRR